MEYHEEFEDGLFVGRGFLENGKNEGLWYYFYETGELKQEIEYANGIKNGMCKFFGKDGKLLVHSANVNGKLNGEWCEYYEDGRLKETGKYCNDKYSPIDFWDENGKQLLKNGAGKKIEVYGVWPMTDVYEQYFEDGKFVKEIKIEGYTILGFESEGYKSQGDHKDE
jgi:antitoxin component YwqK of YwqJK toxin-antitoxin module